MSGDGLHRSQSPPGVGSGRPHLAHFETSTHASIPE